MERFSVIQHKKNGIVPFVTTWMVLEGIMLCEISQKKTNTTRFYLHMGSKEQNNQTQQKQTQRYRGLPEGRGVGEPDEKGGGSNKGKSAVTK